MANGYEADAKAPFPVPPAELFPEKTTRGKKKETETLSLKSHFALGLAMSESMRQCCLAEIGKFKFETVETPGPPAKGWALLRTGAVGMCGTDYHAFHGKQNFFTFPRVLGHEIGATIVALGEGTECSLCVDDKVAVVPYWGCGECVACRKGKTNCCTTISVLGVHAHGAMREYFLAPVDKCVPSASLSLEQLALVETLCIGGHAVARGTPIAGENVLVIGAGPIGIATAQFAKAEDTNVVVMDINDGRLEFIKKNVPIDHTINSMNTPDIPEALLKCFDGELPTLVFDATGNLQCMETAFNYVAHGGRLVFVGHTKDQVKFNNPLFHSREMTIMGSRNALPADFARVISLIESKKVDVSSWITHTCTLDNFEESFMEWMKPETGVMKGVVKFE